MRCGRKSRKRRIPTWARRNERRTSRPIFLAASEKRLPAAVARVDVSLAFCLVVLSARQLEISDQIVVAEQLPWSDRPPLHDRDHLTSAERQHGLCDAGPGAVSVAAKRLAEIRCHGRLSNEMKVLLFSSRHARGPGPAERRLPRKASHLGPLMTSMD